MQSTITPLIAGNWKMNGLSASLDEAAALKEALDQQPAACRVALCPPATLIAQMAWRLKGGAVLIGAQDCHAAAEGAYTGSISAAMLKDAGAGLVILGHSERRQGFGETDADVAAKVEAALAAGLEPIVCVGETLEERDAGKAVEVVQRQVSGSLPDSLAGAAFSVAYEPVWAIGTGRTPTLEQIAEVHDAVRATLEQRFGQHGSGIAILYGGSVKPANAAEILKVSNVGGALVGGASLKAQDFLGIIRAL
ncbi:triose-phosphate isomerase [Brevundimonas sp. 2R-24]|uniref:Triosephosphate isomerase n=1 Tax=Peiella sedimenti TaxID=3061083 RepID=A0ABT8SKL7_9CAUL|nr:triose-phosphate isomerase [Caulobacteraceae bacterium XZ-24]